MQPSDRLVHISSRRGVDGEVIQPRGNQGAIDRIANVLLDFLIGADNGLSFLKGVEQGIFTCIRLSVPVIVTNQNAQGSLSCDWIYCSRGVRWEQLFDLGKPQESRVSHYLTPQQKQQWLEHNTYYGLSTSDEYLWCYSEEINWWPNNVPSGVEEAIRSAQEKIEMGEPLGFNIEGMIQWARMWQMTKKIIR